MVAGSRFGAAFAEAIEAKVWIFSLVHCNQAI
jgi:hypothetical protein